MKKSKLTLCALLCITMLSSCAQTETPIDEVTRIENPFASEPDKPSGDTEAVSDNETSSDTLPFEDTTEAEELTSMEETTAEPLPTVPDKSETARISFVAAGDNVIHKCIWRDAEIRAQQTGYFRAFNFKPTYADTTSFVKGFDLAFINQETMLGGTELGLESYPKFNSPQEVGLDLKEMGYDIVNIATNHMIDFGEEGLTRTIDFFESDAMDGVTMIGGYRNATDYDSIRTVNCKDVEIALLAYTYGTNGLSLPSESELVIPRIRNADIIRQCELAEKAGDITVVSVHWGNENYNEPTDEQRRVAKLLADNGADIIIGHHPHVLQPIEWIETEHGRTLCIYSLGNIISGMAEWQNMLGGFACFDIVAYDDGTINVDNVRFVPTAFYFGANHLGSHLYFLKDYTEALAQKHGTVTYYNNEYASPETMLRYAEDILGDYLSLEP